MSIQRWERDNGKWECVNSDIGREPRNRCSVIDNDDFMRIIEEFLNENRYAVSLDELCDIVGLGKTSVYKRLHRLKRLGLLDFNDGQSRTVHLTDHGIEHLCCN